MNRISLIAEERTILGKKVKNLRKNGVIPAHVYGKKIQTEHVSVPEKEFMRVYSEAGETGLIDLKIGTEKIKPVMIKGVQVHAVTESPLHVDFYQVDLSQKVTVPVPITLIGEEPETVKLGETVVIQPLSEVEVEALPTDIPEKIEVDRSSLKQIDDAILVSQLKVPEGVIILDDPEAVVVKLDTAITEEMKKLMEEQAAEAAAVATQAQVEAGEATTATEGEEPAEGAEEAPVKTPTEHEKPAEQPPEETK